MTLHTGLANPTSLQSFMVWYCSVCELRESNSKEEEEEDEEFWNRRIGIFPFPCINLHDFLVSGVS